MLPLPSDPSSDVPKSRLPVRSSKGPRDSPDNPKLELDPNRIGTGTRALARALGLTLGVDGVWGRDRSVGTDRVSTCSPAVPALASPQSPSLSSTLGLLGFPFNRPFPWIIGDRFPLLDRRGGTISHSGPPWSSGTTSAHARAATPSCGGFPSGISSSTRISSNAILLRDPVWLWTRSFGSSTSWACDRHRVLVPCRVGVDLPPSDPLVTTAVGLRRSDGRGTGDIRFRVSIPRGISSLHGVPMATSGCLLIGVLQSPFRSSHLVRLSSSLFSGVSSREHMQDKHGAATAFTPFHNKPTKVSSVACSSSDRNSGPSALCRSSILVVLFPCHPGPSVLYRSSILTVLSLFLLVEHRFSVRGAPLCGAATTSVQ
ncbi:hypothetical protein FKM82_025488 [Ascaphus truei]